MAKPVVVFIELKIASKNRYVCDIIEKLYDNGLTVLIYAEDSKSISQLNDQLWTWKQETFIPHAIFNSDDSDPEPVLLTDSENNLPKTQVLVLYDPLPQEKLSAYSLIFDFAELYHSEKKQQSRERFKKLSSNAEFDLHFTQLGAILSKKTISLNATD